MKRFPAGNACGDEACGKDIQVDDDKPVAIESQQSVGLLQVRGELELVSLLLYVIGEPLLVLRLIIENHDRIVLGSHLRPSAWRNPWGKRISKTFKLRGAALFAASLSNELLGCIAELTIEICLMLNIRLAGNEFTMALQAANAELKSILYEDLAGELPDVLH
jgi:hypothetical protein